MAFVLETIIQYLSIKSCMATLRSRISITFKKILYYIILIDNFIVKFLLTQLQ